MIYLYSIIEGLFFTDFFSHSHLIKICNGLNISLSQFFAGIEDNVDNNVLSSEQQDVLSLWNLLDSKSKEFTLIYMKGLAHLPMRGVEDEKF